MVFGAVSTSTNEKAPTMMAGAVPFGGYFLKSTISTRRPNASKSSRSYPNRLSGVERRVNGISVFGIVRLKMTVLLDFCFLLIFCSSVVLGWCVRPGESNSGGDRQREPCYVLLAS